MDALADTLWREFAVETEEHLQAVEPVLARDDPQQASAADVAQLFRSFHSVKGLARAMDMLGMEGVAHHAENLLGLVREGRAKLTPNFAELLLQSVDALKRMRDAVAEQHRDSAPDPELIARLATAFRQAGGALDEPALAPATETTTADTPLHEDPEMLAIFVEMVKTRGPELCAALGADPEARATALDAAETLAHAAEIMNFEALATTFEALRGALQDAGANDGANAVMRADVLEPLTDLRLQIEVVGEITGQDAGIEDYSAALAERIGDQRRHAAVAIGEANRRLREREAAGDRATAAAEAAEIVRLARALYGMASVLSLPRAGEIALLVADLFGRVASGEVGVSAALLDAADEVFARFAADAETGLANDLGDAEAARLAEQLRAPLTSTAQRALQQADAAQLVAGLVVPAELLAVLSDENLAELERGIAEGLLPYEISVHFETDPVTAERLIEWLTNEARPITNRTIVSGSESSFEFLALSPLEPAALGATLASLDPGRRCVKRVRRLTGAAGAEVVLAQAGAGAGPETAGAARSAVVNVIRVQGETLDAFLDGLGEIRIALGGLTDLVRGAGWRTALTRTRDLAQRLPRELRRELLSTFDELRQRERRLIQSEESLAGLLSRLHQSAMELRVVPVDAVFSRLPRMVRDLAQQHGKSVELVLEGRDVRIDKSMVEALADPLIHMVRNALDHGIEPPEGRRAVGKPERARLSLRAAEHGSQIHLAVADDGRGLDVEAIRAKAIQRGRVSAAEANALPDDEVFGFIFEAGLSTAAAVTETSGRGVGMDVVLATVRRLGGDIEIRSERGQGTTFTLTLPVSAALQTALIVRVGDQSLAIPERHILAVTNVAAETIRLVGEHRSILHRQAIVPLYELGDLLGLPDGAAPPARAAEPVVVTTNGRQMIGLEVDAIERRQELFLKDLDPRLARFPGVGGASVLGDGRVVLVLDGEQLIQLAGRSAQAAAHRLAS